MDIKGRGNQKKNVIGYEGQADVSGKQMYLPFFVLTGVIFHKIGIKNRTNYKEYRTKIRGNKEKEYQKV